MTVHLTTAETLMIEVLVARRRLGEMRWPFESRSKSIARSLCDKGLVSWDHGNIEKTIKVWLLPGVFEQFVSPTYKAPTARSKQPPAFLKCRNRHRR